MKFGEDQLVCAKCLIYDGFFNTSACPRCGGTDCIMYKNLTPYQRAKARELKAEMLEEREKKDEDKT